jgi:putative hemolysin
MNNKFIVFFVVFIMVLASMGFYLINRNVKTIPTPEDKSYETINAVEKEVSDQNVIPIETNLNKTNPASDNCVSLGGQLEIITEKDGSQFGMCKLENYSCEEWALFRNECDIKSDSEKIRTSLISKGLDLSGMEILISKHLGKYIAGSVSPVDKVGGGGYFFAVKDGDLIEVLADGNGIIACSSFDDYPDFSTYLVPECVDEKTGKIVQRQ